MSKVAYLPLVIVALVVAGCGSKTDSAATTAPAPQKTTAPAGKKAGGAGGAVANLGPGAAIANNRAGTKVSGN